MIQKQNRATESCYDSGASSSYLYVYAELSLHPGWGQRNWPGSTGHVLSWLYETASQTMVIYRTCMMYPSINPANITKFGKRRHLDAS